MKVILREDVADLGTAGQTIEVKDGYGRNYLIPRNLAIVATKANLKAIGEFVSALPNKPPVTLLAHHATAMGKYARFGITHRLPAETAVPTDETMGDHAARLNEYGLEVSY